MLEAPTPATILDVLAEPSGTLEIDRRKGRAYAYGYSEGGIERIDLHHVETTASSDGAFAAALERAIEAGLERDLVEPSEEYGTERPMALGVPHVPLGEQIPCEPQQLRGLAESFQERAARDASAAQDAREAEKAQQSAACRGAFTLFDLRAGVCHFSASESSPYFFCGAPTGADSKPWCPFHHRVCYPQP